MEPFLTELAVVCITRSVVSHLGTVDSPNNESDRCILNSEFLAEYGSIIQRCDLIRWCRQWDERNSTSEFDNMVSLESNYPILSRFDVYFGIHL